MASSTGGAILRESLKRPKTLYKHLMRECNKLPDNAQEFYRHSIRQSFKQHVIEPDPERVQQIMEKAIHDAEWVLKKYNVSNPPKTNKQ